MCLFDIEMLFFYANKSHVCAALNNTTSLYLKKKPRKQSNPLLILTKYYCFKGFVNFFYVKVEPDKI